MGQQLFVTFQQETVARFPLAKGLQKLGGGAGADLVFSHPGCPAVLCQVNVSFDGEVHVQAAGVTLVREPAGRLAARQRLQPGGFVDVGDFRLTLLELKDAPALVVHESASVAAPTAGAREIQAPQDGLFSLEIENQGAYVRHDLDKGGVLFGRGARKEKETGRAFLELGQDSVSRDHCEVFLDERGRAKIRALTSKHGTFVNGHELESGGTLEVKPGDLVQITLIPGYPSFVFSTRAKAIGSPRGAPPHSRLLGTHATIRAVRAEIQKLEDAPRTAIVLILGQSGTGKELAAVALHAIWTPDRPFLPLNCGAISETLIESELFGHVKGAFTGADRQRAGIFEAAQGGVVFLDEIGELPLAAQVKLLRVIQESKVQRVGSSDWIPVHFRLVCATHRNLYKMMQRGTFREDLYHRIAQVELNMPSLAERASDIPILARSFLEPNNCEITDAALAVLQSRTWPGNVRQFKNVLDRSRLAAKGTLIDTSDLVILTKSERVGIAELEAEAREARAVAEGGQGPGPQTLADLDLCKRQICERALREALGNRSAAARALGVNARTLNAWLKAWGL